MAYVGILLSGATLFLNGLMLAGKAEVRSVAIFNFLVGILQVIIPFYLIMISDQSNWTVYGYAATFLFGLTFLYVGFTFFFGMSGTGLGWFAWWVAIIAIVYALMSIFHFHDYVSAIMWFMWSYLWYLFYILNIIQKPIAKYVSKVAIIQSWLTLTFPTLFYFIGIWETVFVQRLWLILLVIFLVYFTRDWFRILKVK